jgi:hypothetical protein
MENKVVFLFMLATMLTTVAEPFTSNDDVMYVESALPDTDGDGINDYSDAFPLNYDEHTDTDGDGWGDNADLCPRMPDVMNSDYDNDTIGDVCDTDDDNDGVLDEYDLEPFGDAERNYTILMAATQLMDIQRNQPDEPFLIIDTPLFDVRTHNHSGYMANATVKLNIDDHINSQVMLNISAWDSDYGYNEDDYYGYCHLYLPALNTCRGDHMRVLAVDTHMLFNDYETKEQVSIWVSSESPTPKENYASNSFFGNLWSNLLNLFEGFIPIDDAENMAIKWITNAFLTSGGTILLL